MVNVGATAALKLVLRVGDIAQTITVSDSVVIDPAQTDVSCTCRPRNSSAPTNCPMGPRFNCRFRPGSFVPPPEPR